MHGFTRQKDPEFLLIFYLVKQVTLNLVLLKKILLLQFNFTKPDYC
jgi:hypothetical protein